MKKIVFTLVIIVSLLLTGCSGSYTAEDLEKAREEGYEAGMAQIIEETGYDADIHSNSDLYQEGYQDGFDKGCEAGYEDGYADGYADGQNGE